MTRPIITLLTDFGLSDHYVGAMKGVMLGICPDAQLVDITHDIAPFQVGHAAWMLQQVWRSFPAGTVHLAVVDPGVGSARRPVLAEAGGQSWVAPDNGLLTRVLADAGKPVVREITATRYFRHPVSRTFHGRDVFAPVAAHLAAGIQAADLGPSFNEFAQLPNQAPIQLSEGEWSGEVLWVDRFGNIVTSFDAESFSWVSEGRFELRVGEQTVHQYEQYYDAMEMAVPYVTTGSAGYLEVALNQQDAAALLRVGRTCRLQPGPANREDTSGASQYRYQSVLSSSILR